MEDKNSQRCYFAWKNLQWGFCDVGCSCSFTFVSSFCCCSSVILFFIFVVVVLHFISTSSLNLTWTITGFFHPFYTFSPAHCRVIRNSFILTFPRSSFTVLPRALWFWVGIFLPTGIFYLTLLHQHFTCVYQGLPGSWQFFLEICRASYWSLKHRPGPSVCLIHSNPQPSYSEEFIFKFYQILSWIACGKSLAYLLLTRFKLLSLVQSICKDY